MIGCELVQAPAKDCQWTVMHLIFFPSKQAHKWLALSGRIEQCIAQATTSNLHKMVDKTKTTEINTTTQQSFFREYQLLVSPAFRLRLRASSIGERTFFASPSDLKLALNSSSLNDANATFAPSA
jgi:hypothetical protein